jgi:hypothetical protein
MNCRLGEVANPGLKLDARVALRVASFARISSYFFISALRKRLKPERLYFFRSCLASVVCL